MTRASASSRPMIRARTSSCITRRSPVAALCRSPRARRFPTTPSKGARAGGQERSDDLGTRVATVDGPQGRAAKRRTGCGPGREDGRCARRRSRAWLAGPDAGTRQSAAQGAESGAAGCHLRSQALIGALPRRRLQERLADRASRLRSDVRAGKRPRHASRRAALRDLHSQLVSIVQRAAQARSSSRSATAPSSRWPSCC
jgi:hypothetical protein